MPPGRAIFLELACLFPEISILEIVAVSVLRAEKFAIFPGIMDDQRLTYWRAAIPAELLFPFGRPAKYCDGLRCP
jgi:hypothetical protein